MINQLRPLGLVLFGVIYTSVIALAPTLSAGVDVGPPLVWPAAGVYFAFLMLSAVKEWWKLAVMVLICGLAGNSIANVPLHPHLLLSWVLVSSSMALSVVLLRFSSQRFDEHSVMRAILFVLIGGLVAPTLSAGLSSLLWQWPFTETQMQAFRFRFAGNSLGILTVTPFILSVYSILQKKKTLASIDQKELLINGAIFIVTLVIALEIFVFSNLPQSLRYPFMVVPLLVVISFRGSIGFTTTANMILSFLAFYNVIYGDGLALESKDALEALTIVQMFVATTTFTHILLTTAVRKRTEVARALDEKSKELERVNRELDQAKLLAVAASDAKSSFLANMSHEIRSPLSAMIGYAELLQSSAEDTEVKKGYGDVIRRNGQHLLELVNQILDLSKIEAGKFDINLQSTQLRVLILDVKNLMEHKAKEKGLALKFVVSDRTPQFVVTDDLRVRQILINGIGNAIKFTQEGAVVVRMDCVLGEDQRYRIRCEIEDTGIGLDEKEKTMLFRSYSQANASISSLYGGTGLGLELSRNLARRLGGDYELLRSEKNRGSVFVLHVDGGEPEPLAEALSMLNLSDEPSPLPLPLPHSLSQLVPVTPENPLEGLRILLVDDAADNRFLITRFLQLSGARVESAENGRRAIEKLHDSNYDLVLMDIEMPEMNGLETVSFLRSELYEGPVIALSGRAMPDEIEECRRAGFDSHLIKPVDRRKLVASIFESTRGAALPKV